MIGFQGYAPGAIKSRAELTDLIAEAGKSKRAIRIYAVEQSGHQSDLFITSKTPFQIRTFDGGWQYEFFDPWTRSVWSKKRYYKCDRSLSDLNITGKVTKLGGHNRHQLFRNKRCADEYAAALSTDAEYLRSVAAHHAKCARIFGELGW